MPSFSVRHPEGETIVYLEARQKGGKLWYRFSVRNRQHWRSAKTTNERQAREVARKAVYDAVEAQPGGLSAAAAVDAYLDAKHPIREGVDTKSRRELSLRLKAFVDLHPLDLRSAGESGVRVAVRDYLQRLVAANYAARTIANEQLALHGWLAWVIQSYGPDGTRELSWTANPARRAGLGLPQANATPKPPLPPAFVERLLKKARGHRVYPVLLLIAGGAIRPRAACRVQWEDVQGNRVRTVAKGRERFKPLAAWAGKELARLHAQKRRGGAVFDAVVEVAHASVQKLRKLAKLPDSVTLQAVRRTAAYQLSRQVDPMLYAHMMDHTLAVAQRHYLNFDAYDATGAVNKAFSYASPLQKPLHEKRKVSKRKVM